jgi:hypothetical protein
LLGRASVDDHDPEEVVMLFVNISIILFAWDPRQARVRTTRDERRIVGVTGTNPTYERMALFR